MTTPKIQGPPAPAPAHEVRELDGEVIKEEVLPLGAAPRTLDDLLDLDEFEQDLARMVPATQQEYNAFDFDPEP